MIKSILIEMPTKELTEEFWSWWLDGGGEAAMYENIDGIGASSWSSEVKHIIYKEDDGEF